MKEQKYWPFVEVRRVANGWIVEPGRYDRGSFSALDDMYVFEHWDECSEFIKVATVPTRPATV